MKKTLLAALAAAAISSAVAVAGARLLFVPQEARQESLAEEGRPAAGSIDAGEGYYISGYEGVVAVFRESDREKPLIVFENVYLHSLPEYDRRQLESGVYAESYTKLSSLLEDYIS